MSDSLSILLSLLQFQPDEQYSSPLIAGSPQEWQKVVELSTVHRVDTLFIDRLLKSPAAGNIPEEIRNAWSVRLRKNAARNLQIYAEISRISAALTNLGIIPVVLKGPFLAEKIYGNIALRRIGDIDILVEKEHLDTAYRFLIEHLGYREQGMAEFNHSGHLSPLLSPNKISLELHWSITGSPAIAAEMLQRSLPVQLNKAMVRTFSPEDNLLYQCAHIAHSHQFGFGALRSACDIAWMIDHLGDDLNWDLCLERSQRWGWNRMVFLALSVSKTLIGARVPAAFLYALSGSDDWSTMLDIAIEQTLTPSNQEGSVSENMADFWAEKNAVNKVRRLLGTIFLPRQKLAELNNLPENSLKLYWLYIVRLGKLLRDHSQTFFRLSGGDNHLRQVAARRYALSRWLEMEKPLR